MRAVAEVYWAVSGLISITFHFLHFHSSYEQNILVVSEVLINRKLLKMKLKPRAPRPHAPTRISVGSVYHLDFETLFDGWTT